MESSKIILMTTLFLVILGSTLASGLNLGAYDGLRSISNSLQNADVDKIDSSVISLMETASEISVMLLGSDQLLDFPSGYQAFINSNGSRTRSELRSQITAELKSIASEQQQVILEKLGNPDGALTTWLVNGIFVTLSPDEIEQASQLDEVLYIYSEQLGATAASPGGVRDVLESSEQSSEFTTSGKEIPWNVEDIGARKVWDEFSVIGEGITVAIIDFGINYTHTDLRSNIWINADEIANNGIDDDMNGYVDDIYGYNFGQLVAEVGNFDSSNHGTWVAGIIAGDGTGGIQTGIVPRAKLMSLTINNTYSTILAHQYALDEGADITNMSFSIPDLGNMRAVWRLMAEHASIAGLVLVSGAGNFQQTEQVPEQLRTPENIPSVIAAGGVDQNLNFVTFSSMGPVEWSSVKFYEDFPELVKPDIVGFPGAGYPVLEGTGSGYVNPNTSIRGNSFSGPHAAGVAALILSANPELPAWRVKEIMESTARDIDPPGKDNQTGSGLIDAFEAVRLILAEN